MKTEKTRTQQKINFFDLSDDVLTTIFYTLNIEREKEKSTAISIIKILSDRNKLELLINKSSSST